LNCCKQRAANGNQCCIRFSFSLTPKNMKQLLSHAVNDTRPYYLSGDVLQPAAPTSARPSALIRCGSSGPVRRGRGGGGASGSGLGGGAG
jgi:hypothetical protein